MSMNYKTINSVAMIYILPTPIKSLRMLVCSSGNNDYISLSFYIIVHIHKISYGFGIVCYVGIASYSMLDY